MIQAALVQELSEQVLELSKHVLNLQQQLLIHMKEDHLDAKR